MRTQRNIFIAFLLNLSFSVFEFFGGMITGSVAILSDAVHDLGDAISIGLSWFLEHLSKKEADSRFTYGYRRFSVLGGVLTTAILIVGSLLVMIGAVRRLLHPVTVDYSKMIVFALVGVVLNFVAALMTRHGDSINQKSVNLHMLEDVLGWLVVLVGAIVMRFTDLSVLDPLMSMAVALFILLSAGHTMKEALDVFLEKAPDQIDLAAMKAQLLSVEGVDDIHHIHVWSIDGVNHYATMHIVTKSDNAAALKAQIRARLHEQGICHAVLETEAEACGETECHPPIAEAHHHHHHG